MSFLQGRLEGVTLETLEYPTPSRFPNELVEFIIDLPKDFTLNVIKLDEFTCFGSIMIYYLWELRNKTMHDSCKVIYLTLSLKSTYSIQSTAEPQRERRQSSVQKAIP